MWSFTKFLESGVVGTYQNFWLKKAIHMNTLGTLYYVFQFPGLGVSKTPKQSRFYAHLRLPGNIQVNEWDPLLTGLWAHGVGKYHHWFITSALSSRVAGACLSFSIFTYEFFILYFIFTGHWNRRIWWWLRTQGREYRVIIYKNRKIFIN